MFEPPELDQDVLEAMRAPPRHEGVQHSEINDGISSGDDDKRATPEPVGAFPSALDRGKSESARSYY